MEEQLKGEPNTENISLTTKSHQHDYQEDGNYLKCSVCSKKILNLNKGDKEGLLIGKRGDGSKYTVRTDRRRYFFPDEWSEFIKQFKNKTHKFFFITALHTGGRMMEILNLRYKDIDEDRPNVHFSVVKQRKAKKNHYATGKTREFFVASNFVKEYKSFVRGRVVNPEHYIFLDNSKLAPNYEDLDNSQRKEYYKVKAVAYGALMKRAMKKTGIKDWYNFSPHNIRKTYGMWMRTFNFEMGELCYRLGHDIDTYIAHYGSSLIFTDNERRKISKIMGETK